MPAEQHRRNVIGRLVVIASAAVIMLSGCTLLPESVRPTPAASTTPTASQTAEPVEIALYPEGSAEENLPYFSQTVTAVWNSEQAGSSRAYFDALVAAGFEASAITRLSDTTAIGLAADTFSIAVAWHDGRCLIGQVGASTGEAVSAVAPQLAGGSCLVGAVIAGE